MNIIIDVPDEISQRVLDAVTSVVGYNPDKDGEQLAFVEAYLFTHLKNITSQHETNVAAEEVTTKIKTAEEKVETDFNNALGIVTVDPVVIDVVSG